MIRFHKHVSEISVYRKDKEWRSELQSLTASQCCERVAAELVAQKHSLRAVNMLMEKAWWDIERPYYNVWPSVLQMIEDVDLDVPMRCLTLPHATTAICFAEGTKHGLMSCLVGTRKAAEGQLFISLSASVFWNKEIVTVWRFGQLRGDEPFSVFARCREDNPAEWSRTSESCMTAEQESEILRIMCHIFCGVAILASDATLVQPIVLNRDLLKYQSADEVTKKYLEERAARRNGRGFNVGKKLEEELKTASVSPHVRKPHMALFWTGKGRTIPVLQLRRGAYVHRADVTKVPTGFMDRESQAEG